MTTQVQDPAMYALTPFEMSVYLRSRGWSPVATYRDTATIWQIGNISEKILLPRNRELDDYAERVREILYVLAQVEERTQAQIWQDVSFVSADVIRLRLTGEQVTEGSLPLDNAVVLMQRAHDLMLAAACSAVAPRAAYPTRRPARAVEYMKRVRSGQTERGSYVLTLISPVEPELESGEVQDGHKGVALIGGNQPPFERRVVEGLITGLTETRRASEAITSSPAQEPFANAVESGVSANLCEAVADLLDVGGGNLEVGCAWSRARPVPTLLPRVVTLSHDFGPVVRAAARTFRENSLRNEEAEVRGFVELATKRQNAVSGRVVIFGTVNGQARRVEANLAGDVYKEAVRAHEREVPVLVYGRIMREGRGYVLKSPRDFQVE